MLERNYQARLIKELKRRFPGCVILKNDSSYLQGVPDLIILYFDRWAMLEVKLDCGSSFRPNQEYYLDLLNQMSFATVIYPEIEEEVLSALQLTFEPRRPARLLKR
jgi:hypothetical protein